MNPKLPKYAQLIAHIQAQITSGELPPEAQLPNEDDLATRHRMSRGTVRMAIAELQRLGLVRKEQGRGTFINEQKPRLNGFSVVEFDHYVQAQNRQPGTRTLQFERRPASADIAARLNISATDPVWYLAQLRLADEQPIIYEERHWPHTLSPDLTPADIDQHTIHWLLIERYQVPLVRLSHDIRIATLPAEKFDLFNVNTAVEVFQVERLSYTTCAGQTQPAVWYQALYRADDYPFQVQFHSSI